MRYVITTLILAACLISCTEELSDNEYDSLYMANKEFSIYDSNLDGQISMADIDGIKNNGSKYKCKKLLADHNVDSISKADFIDSYQTPEITINGKRVANVVYKSVGEERIMMDLFLPNEEDRPDGLTPVVLFFHGGGWRSGDKYIIQGKGYQPIVDELLKQGIAVASVNYRFIIDGEQFVPTVVSDAKDAVAFIHRDGAQYGIDGERVIVWGGSAGGHLSLMCGFTDVDSFPGDKALSKWRQKPTGVVSWYGSGDFTLGSWEDAIARGHETFYKCFTDSKETEELQAKGFESAPLTHISSDDPHTILFGGDADVIVSINDAIQMYDKLQECGVKSELIVVHGAGHGWSGKDFTPNKEQINKLTFDSVLKIFNMQP